MNNSTRRTLLKNTLAISGAVIVTKAIATPNTDKNVILTPQNITTDITNTDSHQSFYYANRKYESPQNSLNRDIKCNICIIGGGLTGITTALNLARAGISDIILVESDEIGSGASGINGGQLSVGYEESMQYVIDKYDVDLAKKLWPLSVNSVSDVRRNINTYGIDCHWINGIGGVAYKPEDFEDLKNEYELLKSTFNYHNMELYNTKDTRDILASDLYHGMLYDKTSAHINPLNYLLGITNILTTNFKQQISIYTYSPVSNVEKNEQSDKFDVTIKDKFTITANKIILAANFSSTQIYQGISNKTIAVRDIVLTTTPLPQTIATSLIKNNMAVYDTRNVMNYYRLTEDNSLLFGGGAPQGSYDKKSAFLSLYNELINTFPQLQGVGVSHFWEGLESTTVNKLPYIGYTEDKNVYYAQGFTGHGLNISNIAARVMVEAITGDTTNIDFFKQLNHISVPRNETLQDLMSNLGVLYFKMKDW